METPTPQENQPQHAPVAGPQPTKKQGRIASFFHRIGRSCYDMEFYRGVRIKPWGSAFAYLLWFQLAITLVFTAMVVPALVAVRGTAITFIETRIPDGTTLAVHRGKIATNLHTPFVIHGKDFELQVDTGVAGPTPPESFGGMPGMFIGQDVVAMQDGRKLTSYKASDFPDFSVTKDGALGWLRSWSVLMVAAGGLGFALMYFVFATAGALLFVTCAAAAMSVIGSIWKVKISYAQWHALGLHAVTLPTLLQLVLDFTKVQIPFAYTFIFFMIMAAVIADERARPTPAKAA